MVERTSSPEQSVPAADRPEMAGYGIHETVEGQLPWAWAVERLAASRNYWICSTRPDGRPHAMPVWGVWSDGALFFGTSNTSRKGRNLAANPAVAIHLESGDEAVILEGVVEHPADSPARRAANAAYGAKYINPETGQGFSLTDGASDEATEGNGIFMLRPKVAFAWTEREFPKSATRWRFPPA